MSKGDPFNFNDIYASLGAENLVKRPMAELKKPTVAAVTPAVSSQFSSVQPAKQPAAVSTSTVSTYDFGFLSANQQQTAAPAAFTAHTGNSPSFGLDDLFSGSQAPLQPPHQPAAAPPALNAGGSSSLGAGPAVDADPFAAFETVDGAMPVVASAPSTNPVTPNASMGDLVTHGVGAASGFMSQDPLPSPPATTTAAAPTPLQPYPPVYEAVAASKPSSGSLQAASRTRPAGDGQYEAQQQDSATFPQAPQQHQQPYSQPPQHQPWPTAASSCSQGASSSSGAHKSAATAARGIANFLTDLGKKAAKAAHEGLKHLEQAMVEGQTAKAGPGLRGWGAVEAGTEDEMVAMKPSQSRSQAYASVGGSAGSRMGGAPDTGYAGDSATLGDDQGAAKALDIALRIGDLPVEVRGDALAQLPPSTRVMVEEILREQFLLEEEDRASGRGPAGQHNTLGGEATAQYGGQGYQQFPDSAAGASSEPAVRPSPPPSATVDLLGVDEDLASARHPKQGSEAQGVPSHTQHVFGDFLSAGQEGAPRPAATAAPTAGVQGGHNFGDFLSHSGSVSTPAASRPQQHTDETHDLTDFFSGGQPAPAPAKPTVSRPAASAGPSISALDLIGDLHSDSVDVSNHQELYEDVEGHDGEPEIRRQLRAARLAERNAKMRAALAEKLAKDEEEARRKEEQVQLKDQYKQAVEAWKNKHKGNIRGLLGSLQTVLWENSGWVTVSVGDLLDSHQVKKVYMKANLLVHPDKVRQRNGTAEQVAIADMVFDVLKDAWNVFKP